MTDQRVMPPVSASPLLLLIGVAGTASALGSTVGLGDPAGLWNPAVRASILSGKGRMGIAVQLSAAANQARVQSRAGHKYTELEAQRL